MSTLRAGLERFLVSVVALLMVAMVVVVVLAVVYRKSGASLVWYDEVASIMLAWLTYYGAALAALKRAHIGVPSILEAAPRGLKLVLFAVSEVFVLGFFGLLAWTGYVVLLVLEGDSLVSLPEVSTQFTQSVIPIGAALFVLAEVLSIPEQWRRLQGMESKELPMGEPGS